MDKIIAVLTENIIGILFTIGALSFLVYGNQLVVDGYRQLDSPKTVYVQSEQALEQHYWTGAQVQYLLWSIEELDYSISVGALTFSNLKDVRKHVDSISSNVPLNMKKQVDANGKIHHIQFTY